MFNRTRCLLSVHAWRFQVMAQQNTFHTVNPSNQQKLKEYHRFSEAQVLQQLAQSESTFQVWRWQTVAQKAKALMELGSQLESKKAELAKIITLEMGKPIKQSTAEVEKCMGLIDYAVKNFPEFLAPETRGGFSVHYQPLGVIYGIMPWNFPIWQTLRFAVPTILAGNTVVLKPAENVSGTALVLQECFDAVSELKDVYSTLLIDHDMSDHVIASPVIKGVSLTGSSRAGAHVAQVAGKHLKKCVLELGGNDAYVVCEDADLNLAVEKVFQARLLNTGQSCISAKRVFVHKKREEEFTQKLFEKIKALRIEDPSSESAEFGPVARIDLRDGLKKQVEQIQKDGARVTFVQDLQGLEQKGAYYPITVLQHISKDNSVHTEELFGPVYSIIAFETEEEAVAMANSSQYGLGGAIFSKNVENAKKLALQIETGSLAINDFFRSTFERPFGGIKNSGYGRELGKEGFHEFTNIKVII